MYLVAGVTGHTGSAVAERLLDRKQPLRVLVRSAAKGKAWAKRGAQVAVGDLGDAASLDAALAGVEGAYLLIPPPAPGTTGILERGRKLTDTIRAALDRAGGGALRHVAFLSSVGADVETSGVVRVLHHAEKELRTLRTPITFLRAAYFMENWESSVQMVARDGVLSTFFGPAERTLPMIATRDIGMLAAEALIERPMDHRTLDLAGPRDYSPADVAAAFGRLLARPVQLKVMPVDQMVPILTSVGIPAETAELLREMTAEMSAGRIKSGGGTLVRGSTPIENVLGRMIGK